MLNQIKNSSSPSILFTGAHGLVGSRIVSLLSETFDFITPRSSELDITDKQALEDVVEVFGGDWIIHAAAYTDVDGCEKDVEKARSINVTGTKNVVDAARKYGKRVCFISTDFVFDGTADSYTEESVPHPLGVYGQTKCEGENVVRELDQFLILRIAYPYSIVPPIAKPDFVGAIRNRLQSGLGIAAPTDNFFTPTCIDDIAHALEILLKTQAHGIYHVVGSSSLSSYDAAIQIARKYNCDEGLVEQTTHSVYYQNRAKRPLQLVIKNDKIASLGVHMRTFEEGLAQISQG